MERKHTKYPVNFERAADFGRVAFIEMSVDDARDLIAELSPQVLLEALDDAQASDDKPQYVILQIGRRGE